MNRRQIVVAALAAVLAAGSGAARADEVSDLINDLKDFGFDEVEKSTSLLGRVQLRAVSAEWTRELVVNPRTGEILRDVWLDKVGKVAPAPERIIAADDDDDDDRDDDDDDDDEGGRRGRGRGRGRGGDDDDEGDDD